MPLKDPIARAAYCKAYYERNKEDMLRRSKEWKASNTESETQHKRTYRKKNMGQFVAYTAKRRAAKLQRTPSWSNLEAIEAIYHHAPRGYDVDHIYPLQGKTVSGLHVPANLQYLTKSDNCSKGNRYNA